MMSISRVWVLALISLVFAGRSVANTIYVDTNATGPVHDGSSWCDAYLYLQDGLAAAAAGDEIHVADGVYKPDQGGGQTLGSRAATFQLINGVTITGGYAGCGAPDPDERDIAVYETILSGDLAGDDVVVAAQDLMDEPTRAENSYHVVTGSGTNESASLDGCTVIGGNASESNPNPLGSGGGMYTVQGAPRVISCTFSGNFAKLYGGGMYNLLSDATVINCKFRGNSTDGSGCGIANRESDPTITNCAFSGNTANSSGGGMYNFYSSPTLTNCAFTDNSAPYGGGMSNTFSNPTVRNCIFWDNFPLEISGGSPSIRYSNVRGGYQGEGNIDSDPMFVDAAGGNWRLRSESPCIDSGDNDAVPVEIETDLNGDLRFADHECAADSGNGSAPIVDMGAYELQSPATCGNDVCDAGETCETCACDCGICCGDGVCGDFEDCLSCAGDCPCETVHVPGDYESIQAAIDASRDGDEIIVGPGTYYEAIDFRGKAIALRSSDGPDVTTIDASGLETSVVTCAYVENAGTLFEGFTVTGGNAHFGGGMYILNSDPTVTNCTFSGNSASYGGGMSNRGGSSTTVTNCTFSGNIASIFGGGLSNDNSAPTVTNCRFIGNSAAGGLGRGGGMENSFSAPTVTNCTFSGNSAVLAGGMYNEYGDPTVTNCVLWGNFPQEIVNNVSFPAITYSDIRGGYPGEGNVESDPMFVDATGGDWRLRSESPCIDSGDNDAVPEGVDTDMNGDPRFADHVCADDTGNGSGAIVDMGAYEFQDQAGCGDGLCDDEESCETCACDCGGCCGDAVCADYEHCISCADDCACEMIDVPGDYESIQEAIDASRNGDEIIVGPGTYDEAIDFLGKAITLRSSDGPEVTTIDASGLESPVVTCAFGEGADTLLEGFTLTGGNATSGGGMYNSYSSPTVSHCRFSGNSASSGGGMYNRSSSPMVSHSTFSANSAGRDGGGMFNESGSPTVSNCTFSGNSANFGGGMHNSAGSPTVTDCAFTGNLADLEGGGMYNWNSSTTVTNCAITDNAARYNGGGMHNEYSSPTVTNCTFTGNSVHNNFDGNGGGMGNSCSSPTVTDCSFIGNSANGNGGGMNNDRDSDAAVTHCTFSGNSAVYDGGGMSNVDGSDPAVTDCVFSGNSAVGSWSHGGGMYNEDSSPTVADCTFRGNSANNNGGGMSNEYGDPTITDCTFTANEAEFGGGMYNVGSGVTVRNCAFNGNWAIHGGGGMQNGGSLVVINCLFVGNWTRFAGGGGMVNVGGFPQVINCTFIENAGSSGSGGAMVNRSSNPTVTNSIFRDNALPQIDNSSSSPTITYSNVQGGYEGEGNMDVDPLFALGPAGCFYLSRASAGQAMDSPLIDVGSDTVANMGLSALTTRTDEAVDTGIVDLGYHYPVTGLPLVMGDYDHNRVVNLADFAGLQNCLSGSGAADLSPCCRIFDFESDDDVDLDDYAAFEAALSSR